MAEQHGSPLTRAIRQVRDRSSSADDAVHRAGWARGFSGVRSAPEGHPPRREASRSVRRTEYGGCVAVWRLDRNCVRIVEVRAESGRAVSVVGTPDLAEMRERCPELAPLWDAVRHDLWTSLAVAAGRG
ncbi:hypothetical protein [Nocardia sp. NBC_01329]|uniref:hypothetical protein n=1 Tax=Nocardia sp. NBC_01329 TaxID=2903594 RepID=UPI002E121F5B|nr:hypothetical protein OG405_20775 [Nocardia sp. NBC_01329]